jgi:hypothetical protein
VDCGLRVRYVHVWFESLSVIICVKYLCQCSEHVSIVRPRHRNRTPLRQTGLLTINRSKGILPFARRIIALLAQCGPPKPLNWKDAEALGSR